MNIEIITRSKTKRDLIHAVVSLYAQILNVENSKYKLLIGTVPNLMKEESVNGALTLVAEKHLLMVVDSRLNMEQLMQTLAHEMVHVKQYAKGQLKVGYNRKGEPHFIWLGKKRKEKYFDQPWELEAFSRERIMANRVAQIIYEG